MYRISKSVMKYYIDHSKVAPTNWLAMCFDFGRNGLLPFHSYVVYNRHVVIV